MKYDTTQSPAERRVQRNRTLVLASLAGVAAVGALVATQRRRRGNSSAMRTTSRGVYVHEAITINRPLAEVYQFWRNFENLPRFMSHLDAVETLDANRSRWRARGPAGLSTDWEAEIITERENESISWRSLEGSGVQHTGTVRFEHAPGARGTEVHVQLHYIAPGGALGRGIARLLGQDPEQQIRHDLRRFKQLLETGEIALSDGPGLWRPAQPPERPEDVKGRRGVMP